MKKIFSTVLFALFAMNLAYAQAPAASAAAAPAATSAPAASDCEAKAVGKNGKPLARLENRWLVPPKQPS